jgi:Thioredoxin like C-terminal domain
MDERIDQSRRRFLGATAMTLAAAPFGAYCAAGAEPGESRELAALGRAADWLNSPRLTASQLAGKVVLVDFCTYSCINWLRTLPYRRAWAQKYSPGLVLIGVHTPEFGFEKNIENVRRALRQMNVQYPVVIDNDYAIWRAFDNNYWPALYFLDERGRVRGQHFGEGEYESSERRIQRMLADAGAPAREESLAPVAGTGIELPADWASLKSPETYVGYARTQNFASPGGARRDRRHLYAAPDRMARNQWAVSGDWTMGREAIGLARPGGRILCHFQARDLHVVLGPPGQGTPVRFKVSLDGQPPGAARGGDVDAAGAGSVVEPRLYQMVRQSGPIVDRQFEIEFLDAGVEVFAFTFG